MLGINIFRGHAIVPITPAVHETDRSPEASVRLLATYRRNRASCLPAYVKSCLLIIVFVFLAFLAPPLKSQPLHPVPAKVDSLLLCESVSEARRVFDAYISSHPKKDSSLVRDYQSLFNRVADIPNLPDTIVTRFAHSGLAYQNRFLELNAGPSVAACFREYLDYMDKQQYPAAYERLIVSEFFRRRHVVQEKQRLLWNLARTRELVEAKDFRSAAELIGTFRLEEQTGAFLQLKQHLDRDYRFLSSEVEEGLRKRQFEESREEIDRFASAGLEGGLDPFFHLKNADLHFYHKSFATPTTIFLDEGHAIAKALSYWGGNVGVFLVRSLQIGILVSAGSVSGSNSIRDLYRIQRAYRLRMEFRSVGVRARYYFDRRTGYRPFVEMGVARSRKRIFSENDPQDPTALYIDEVAQTRTVLTPAFGLEFDPFGNSPMVSAFEIQGQLPLGQQTPFGGLTAHFACTVGVQF